VMVRYGDLQTWVAVLVNAALVAYLSFFIALFASVVRRITIAHGPRTLIAAPVVWVATEFGRNWPFGGFPWVLLGYSQVTVLPIPPRARIFGVRGVSMLVASMSTALAMSGPSVMRREPAPPHPTAGILRPLRSRWAARVVALPPYVWVFFVVFAVAVWGARR